MENSLFLSFSIMPQFRSLFLFLLLSLTLCFHSLPLSAVKIEGLGAVAAVACGQDHSLALCDSGQVFSWGAGGEGQLGQRNSAAKCPKPV